MNIFRRYTLNTLKKNKVRTVVTIIGIILSVAMFTATTESFVTVQNYLVKYAETYHGSYHVGFSDVTQEDSQLISKSSAVSDFTYMQNIGYAPIASQNEYKPYLFIAGIPENFTDIMPLQITEGRLPESEGEILVSEHLYTNGGVKLTLGQKLTLQVGQRQWSELTDISAEEYECLDGDSWQKLTQHTPLRKAEDEAPTEKLINTKEKTYTVVGFCLRPDMETMEPYSAPGYTAFTVSTPDCPEECSIYAVLSQPGSYTEFRSEIHEITGADFFTNRTLLMFGFHSNNSAFTAAALGLLFILLALILFGSVSLIYNSFSISVAERTRQFGILKSIGATKRQIRLSVLYEAVVLCSIGIPIGLLSGCIGMGITFQLLSDTIATFLSELSKVEMSFVFSPVALIASSLLSFITVVISAYIPARKAIKISPIESVRQSKDIKISRRSVRISPLTQKIFGFEATLSSKNFKRNKRKYRSTVISLFVSVVLFISASSLAVYFTDLVEAESQDKKYDVAINIYNYDDTSGSESYTATEQFRQKLYRGLESTKGIDEFTLSLQTGTTYSVDKKYISDEYLDMIAAEVSPSEAEESFCNGFFTYCFIDDNAFRRLLRQEGVKDTGYFDKENPKALAYDMGTHIYQNQDKERIYTLPFLDTRKDSAVVEISQVLSCYTENGEDYYHNGKTQLSDGIIYYAYEKSHDVGTVADEGSLIYLPEEKATEHIRIDIGAFLREKPYFAGHDTCIIYPESAKETVMPEGYFQTHAFILSKEHTAVASSLSRLIRDIGGNDNVHIVDYASEIESIRALVTVIKVLAYGFIVLISLIAAANMFNTLSTGISLRRREFATLFSVGLTSKGLRRMMLFEALLYGIKSLLFSLPVSLLITCLIYTIIANSGYTMSFYIPRDKFIIAIIGVFLIVAVSIVYSVRQLRKESTVETLRRENI